MNMYRLAIALHFAAFALWLGHLFVWSLITGPALKSLQPVASSELLRERSLFLGGIGWPALLVLIGSGAYLLQLRGIAIADLLTAAPYAGAVGTALAVKLSLVIGMVAYQAIFAHRSAPLAVYVNMLFAIGVVTASVVLVRGFS
jgi:hypothetical protein